MSTHIALSLGEFESLCLKALRGAGLPWGAAEEGAFASGWLAERGIAAAPALARLAQAYAEGRFGPFSTLCPADTLAGVACCPLSLGAGIGDAAQPAEQVLALVGVTVSEPVLLLPFIARVAGDQSRVLETRWASGACVNTGFGGLLGRGGAAALAMRVDDRVEHVGEQLEALPLAVAATHRRHLLDADCHAVLARLAHRTYVPASEQSRTSGAGAALPDDD